MATILSVLSAISTWLNFIWDKVTYHHNKWDGSFKLKRVSISRRVATNKNSNKVKFDYFIQLEFYNKLSNPDQPFLITKMHFINDDNCICITWQSEFDEYLRCFPVEKIALPSFIEYFNREKNNNNKLGVKNLTSIILDGYYILNSNLKLASQIEIQITKNYRKKLIQCIEECNKLNNPKDKKF